MALKTVTATTATPTSGATADLLADANALTYAGLATGGVTLGGAAFVAAAVVPAHVVAGSLVTGVLLAGSECKKRTGSFLPFLKKDEDKQLVDVTPAPEAAAA